jgi:hypothetical protein
LGPRINEFLRKYRPENINELNSTQRAEFIDKLTNLRDALDKYQKGSSHNKPRGHIRHALSYIGRLFKRLSKRTPSRPMSLSQPLTLARPIPEQQNAPNLRSQVVNDVQPSQSTPQSFQVRIPVQTVTAKRAVSSKASIVSKTVFASMLSELLKNITEAVVRDSVRGLNKKQKQNKSTQREIFESVVEKLNSLAFLSKYNLSAKARATENRAQFKAEDKLEDKSKVAFSKESQRATASGQVIFKTLFDSKGNVVGIEIAGKLKQPEILEATRQAVNLRPNKMVPALTAAAVEAVKNNPKMTFQVLDFVAKTLSQAASANRVDLNVSAARAMQLVVGEVVHTLLSIPDSPGSVAHSYISAKDRSNIAYQVLQKYPKAVLPVLQDINVRANEAGNLNVKRATYTIARRIIQTESVQREILGNFAQNARSPLITKLSSTELGRGMIVKAAEGLIEKVKSGSVKGRMATIVKQILLANSNKFNGNITFETASSFLNAVGKIKLYSDIARTTNRRGKSKKSKPERTINYFSKSYRSYSRPKRTKLKLQPAVRKRLDSIAKEVSRISEESNLIVPNTLVNRIKEHQASIAGTTQAAPATNNPVAGHFTPPETSPRARAELARADALEAAVKESAPLAAINPLNPQAEQATVKRNPMLQLINEIWRLLEVASYDKAATEVKKAIRKLKEANNGIKSILTAMEKFDPLALDPLYEVDLARRLKKIKEEQNAHAAA